VLTTGACLHILFKADVNLYQKINLAVRTTPDRYFKSRDV